MKMDGNYNEFSINTKLSNYTLFGGAPSNGRNTRKRKKRKMILVNPSYFFKNLFTP